MTMSFTQLCNAKRTFTEVPLDLSSEMANTSCIGKSIWSAEAYKDSSLIGYFCFGHCNSEAVSLCE